MSRVGCNLLLVVSRQPRVTAGAGWHSFQKGRNCPQGVVSTLPQRVGIRQGSLQERRRGTSLRSTPPSFKVTSMEAKVQLERSTPAALLLGQGVKLPKYYNKEVNWRGI